MELEQGDIVMCTVEKIARTTVFVKIDGHGEGSIILSEIAPGRIRNLRNYVVPHKRIICKVLRISRSHIDLSLRRVTPKEQKEIREKYKLEKSYRSILKSVLKDKAEALYKEILQEETIFEFCERAKKNPKELEKAVGKADSKKILDILNTQKQKKSIIKKNFSLTSTSSEGLSTIKKLLGGIKEAEVGYISAGNYTIKTESIDLKKADNLLKEILTKVEKASKKLGAEFSIKER